MANLKISDLTAAVSANGTQLFEVSDSGTTYKLTGAQLLAYIQGNLTLSNISDVTATAAELNKLDGMTATTLELNYVDGVTSAIQTQLDSKAAASGGTITSPTITTPVITSPDIDLGSDATGDILYRNSSGAIARLGIGSTDQVLKVASGLPSWGDAGGAAGLEFITTADASNNATIDFTAFDAATYDSYMFSLANVVPASGGVYFGIRLSSDGGSSYYSSTNYNFQYIQGESASPTSYGLNNQTYIQTGTSAVGSGTNEDGMSGQVWVHGPHLAQYTRVNFALGYSNSSGIPCSTTGMGEVKVTTAVNGIRFFFNAGNVESGTITMYGLKNA